MSVLRWFCSRCHSILHLDYRASATALGAYRIAYVLLTLVAFDSRGYAWIADLPPAFFDPPPGPASLFRGFPPSWVFESLDVLRPVLVAGILIGWRTREVSIGLVLVNLYAHLFLFSFGKIDHDILAVITPLLFASTWGRALSVDAVLDPRPRRTDGLARGLLACLLSFGFLTAGLPKLWSWLDFDLSTHGVMSWVLNAEMNDRSYFLAPYFRELRSPWAWEALDVMAIGFELFAVVALFVGPAAFKMWCVAAVLFHLFNYLVLNIPFSIHLPLYMAFADWSPIAHRLQAGMRRLGTRGQLRSWSAIGVGAAAFAWLRPVILSAGGEAGGSTAYSRWRDFVVLTAAATIAVVLAARGRWRAE